MISRVQPGADNGEPVSGTFGVYGQIGTGQEVQDGATAWAGALVEIRGLRVKLGRRYVIDGLDLNVEPGRWTAIIGPNGSGKSTLLRTLAGLIKHDGYVLLDGGDVYGMGAKARSRLVGFAPQVPTLPEGMRVREYVMLGRTPHHALITGPRGSDRAIVDRTLRRLDLAEIHDRPLKSLSGGERQRAVLARALAQEPRLLLLDEPTSALDVGHAQQVLDLIDELRVADGLTVISTVHDLTFAGQYADELVLLGGGSVAARGRPAQVLTPALLAEHYGARADVEITDDGSVRVFPRRRPR